MLLIQDNLFHLLQNLHILLWNRVTRWLPWDEQSLSSVKQQETPNQLSSGGERGVRYDRVLTFQPAQVNATYNKKKQQMI